MSFKQTTVTFLGWITHLLFIYIRTQKNVCLNGPGAEWIHMQFVNAVELVSSRVALI